MLGLVLLYVGLVLINNGLGRILRFDRKALAFLNIVVGVISVFCNFVFVALLIADDSQNLAFFAPAIALLFGITYLFNACNNLFAWDLRPYGYFSLFVSVNAILAGVLDFVGYFGSANAFGAMIWWAWAVLWFSGFVECALGKSLGKFSAYLALVEGIITGWLAGILILLGVWSW
ncbi:AmiS/UreI family transporter [Helicobacter sp. 23-1045]